MCAEKIDVLGDVFSPEVYPRPLDFWERVCWSACEKVLAPFVAQGKAFKVQGLSAARMSREQLMGCVGLCDDAAMRWGRRAAKAEKEAGLLRAKLESVEAEVSELRAKLEPQGSIGGPA